LYESSTVTDDQIQRLTKLKELNFLDLSLNTEVSMFRTAETALQLPKLVHLEVVCISRAYPLNEKSVAEIDVSVSRPDKIGNPLKSNLKLHSYHRVKNTEHRYMGRWPNYFNAPISRNSTLRATRAPRLEDFSHSTPTSSLSFESFSRPTAVWRQKIFKRSQMDVRIWKNLSSPITGRSGQMEWWP